MPMKQIILASTSPRRKEIFEKSGLPFTTEDSNYEEDMTLPLSPQKLSGYLSLGKAKNVAEKHSNVIIIAADTFVVFDNKVLGKPYTPEKTKEMLLLLNGKQNTIITGVTIIDTETNKTESFFTEVKVYLKKLTESEIDNYIKSGEPLDKAGAYALQGLGSVFVEKIEGDFFGAMGLPLVTVVEKLKSFGVYVL